MAVGTMTAPARLEPLPKVGSVFGRAFNVVHVTKTAAVTKKTPGYAYMLATVRPDYRRTKDEVYAVVGLIAIDKQWYWETLEYFDELGEAAIAYGNNTSTE